MATEEEVFRAQPTGATGLNFDLELKSDHDENWVVSASISRRPMMSVKYYPGHLEFCRSWCSCGCTEPWAIPFCLEKADGSTIEACLIKDHVLGSGVTWLVFLQHQGTSLTLDVAENVAAALSDFRSGGCLAACDCCKFAAVIPASHICGSSWRLCSWKF